MSESAKEAQKRHMQTERAKAAIGYFSLVLHTHMPYVARNGAFPVGEDWLYKAISESYLPLLATLAELEEEGIQNSLGLTLTPVLGEQLLDPYIQRGFENYLRTMIEHSEKDMNDFKYFGDKARFELAKSYRDRYVRELVAFKEIGGDIVGAFSYFEKAKITEMIASSATHAFLPGLSEEKSVLYQVKLGIDWHRKHLGEDPRGFWIPECAYTKGLEKILEEEGIDYIVTDSSAVPYPETTRPFLVEDSNVAVLQRSDRANINVWDETCGYPTDDTYLDTAKYYLSSGLHYWRVTGLDVPIEEKAIYEPIEAKRKAFDHAVHFMEEVIDELREANNGTRPPSSSETSSPFVLAAYDTELFGHGWHEAIGWLGIVLRSISSSEKVELTTPSLYLAKNKPRASCKLLETSWGEERNHKTWLSEDTKWMWEEIHKAEKELFELLDSEAGKTKEGKRALKQALRELLLLQASDWEYMVVKDRAKNYSIQRFNFHLERFRNIEEILEKNLDGPQNSLEKIEATDSIFSELDLELWNFIEEEK